jgi:hypothetical protein
MPLLWHVFKTMVWFWQCNPTTIFVRRIDTRMQQYGKLVWPITKDKKSSVQIKKVDVFSYVFV